MLCRHLTREFVVLAFLFNLSGLKLYFEMQFKCYAFSQMDWTQVDSMKINIIIRGMLSYPSIQISRNRLANSHLQIILF